MKSLTKGLRLRQVEEAAEGYELMKRVMNTESIQMWKASVIR